ncbi:type IV toxin-antitoxin system AbiEi family antitoxin domain-containing protein [Kribbella sp. NPDC048915]|uniref:type IV toxin-antitoxin system AbiEi family antitoxin domain-containing protein n=1 Tax=Kribbella sp. NPDC048915 TaxID=3155148 RepID=UPI0033C98384
MNPKLRVLAAARHGWFTRADAATAGYSDSELRRRLRSGQWSRLSRDAYVEPAEWPATEEPWEKARRLHLLKIRAAVERMGDGAVISHQSAAVLHGLPTWGLDLTKVQLTKPAGRARSDLLANVHRSRFAPGEITVVDGLRVVTPARAIVEAACTSSYEAGVVLADAALHANLVTTDALITTADRYRFWHGSPAARAAVRFADGLSESVGESRLRVLMANQGLPKPRLQVEIRDENGRLIARVDFLLGTRLIVEFDGAIKYGALKYGAATDAVLAEKWREDRLRARGYHVVRTGWADFKQPEATAHRIRYAL